MKRPIAGSALLLACLTACSGPTVDRSKPLLDGVFEGVSSPDEEGAIGHISVTVAGGRVTEAQFTVVGADGKLKDQSYGLDSDGQIANRNYYAKAQAAVAAFPVYARELVEVGYPQDVDVISGATWAHDQFVEAATQALQRSQGLTQ
ncbi:MAG: FMN-binding protein [Bifidobacteriaceae bacterium]|jgi:major membrane immunogen (membrane-anchored lipoprotein)|nr:FMN-binding protein [Bifidobacteriaceae bacterium]